MNQSLTHDIADQYDWMDEREGRWTTVEESEDRVTFWLRPTHFRGRWYGLVMKLTVVWLMLATFLAYHWAGWIQLAAVALGGYFTWKCIRDFPRRPRDPFLIIMDGEPDADTTDVDSWIWSESILDVWLRRNTGRGVDDMSMWQVYLRLKGAAKARLIYQEPYWRRGYERASAVANRLAGRWGVEVIEPCGTDSRKEPKS